MYVTQPDEFSERWAPYVVALLRIVTALLFLVGVGPMLPWRIARMDELKRKPLAPSVALLVTLGVALVLGMRHVYGMLAFAFAAFALTANVQEYVRGTAARRRGSSRTSSRAPGSSARSATRSAYRRHWSSGARVRVVWKHPSSHPRTRRPNRLGFRPRCGRSPDARDQPRAGASSPGRDRAYART